MRGRYFLWAMICATLLHRIVKDYQQTFCNHHKVGPWLIRCLAESQIHANLAMHNKPLAKLGTVFLSAMTFSGFHDTAGSPVFCSLCI
ncbi:hypothetical protein DL89DRAFT_6588 [Linderina pennispora]|uniref:Secreted protein n=1 Tax=Linderina pennispora TaxID=61395 RepID=A0A1Y1WK14_9FUNG|nr:uncharacterized protein DL89DRAFT_6588 [Linderina pennispora]ORX73921.1 hypothetical protein DL89DRAFT_6588 [Linderina pennispora]